MEAKDLRIGNLVFYKNISWVKINQEGEYEDYEEPHMIHLVKIQPQDLLVIEKDNRKCKPISLTEEWVLKFEQFDKTDKEGTPCFFNGDNIMLFDRGGCFDAYLHSEVDGSVFFATRLFYVHQLQNFYHVIEKQELTIK